MLAEDNVESGHDTDTQHDTTVIQENLIRIKGKYRKYLLPNDIYLEVKQKVRSSKCRGARPILKLQSKMEPAKDVKSQPGAYNTIPIVIWYHVADYIPPECVKTFALICHQTADIVNTRRFWKQIYKKYCSKSFPPFSWATSLPSYLTAYNLEDCDKSTLRARVVECLFLTYEPFIERAKLGYDLDTLIGCTFEACWQETVGCDWRMIYKFRRKNINLKKSLVDFDEVLSNDDSETDDWETLDGKLTAHKIYFDEPKQHINEGVSLLVIRAERFLPIHDEILYKNGDTKVKLLAIRQKLGNDMRSLNLELDFGPSEPYAKFTTTVKYCGVVSYKVYPWWHPEYQKHMDQS